MKTEEQIRKIKTDAMEDLAVASPDRVAFLQGVIFGCKFALGEIPDAFEDEKK